MNRLLVLVISFILKLRYKRPFKQVICQNYGQPTLQEFRKLQKLNLQRDKSLCDLEFLTRCKSCGVIPKFLYFKTSVKNFTNSKLYLSILHKSLTFEINNKRKKFIKLGKDYDRKVECFKSKVSWLDFKFLLSRLTRENNSKISRVKTIHAKKLKSLGVPLDSVLDASKVIFNLSNRVLSKEEEEILKLGLQFGVSSGKVRFVEHYLHFEKFIQQLSKLKKDNEQFEEISSKIKGLAQEGYKYKPNSNTCGVSLDVLDQLKKDKTLIITKPDKGRGVLILNKSDYVNKTNEILNDETKFKKIDGDWFKIILKLEDKLNRLLRSIKNKLPDNIFDYLFASGSLPGVLYGLPKIHKVDCPIRPILSAIGTFNYNLAKFLVPILSPLTHNDFTIKNSIDFAKEINKFRFTDDIFLASFDVKSLFTNIPLQETIDICVNECDRLKIVPFNLTHKQFRSLLEMSVKESIFLFGDQLFKQIDGVAMGSPLGPTLANVFLCYHEMMWLSSCPEEFKPIKYNRYVDDCFLVFKSKDQAIKFLDYLNNKHKNISFTAEYEQDSKLPFLDISITKDEMRLTTDVYRKSTFTGLGLNFHSFVPLLFKINSIKTLLHRAYNICSTWKNFHEEIERLRRYFYRNSYPRDLLDKLIKRFISSKFASDTHESTVKDTKYIKLPFLGHFSYQLRNTMSSLLKVHYPDIVFKFIFVNKNTIGSLFKVKDSIPVPLCSNVVYCFNCPDCSSRYVGSTSRNLKIRISEHKGISYRTGTKITTPSYSKIREHSLSCNHNINEQDFSIRFRATSASDLRIAESLVIMKEKPDLNGNELATKLLIFS